MGINTGDNEKQGQQQTSMGSAFETSAQQQTRQEQGGKGAFSFRSMSKMARSAMGRTPASEVLQKMTKALTDIYGEAADKNFEVSVIPLDMMSTTSLGVSALIVALRDRQAANLGVAYHTLILEASVEPPAPRFELIGGVNTEISRSIGEAYDQVMMRECNEAVRKQFPQSRLLEASAEVVPRDFNMGDQGIMYSLAANALFAASSALETSDPNFSDLNLANAERDSTLQVRTSFGCQQIHNAVGQPVRNDAQIDLSAAPINQQQNQQQLSVERVSLLSRIGGFFDLVWDPAAPVQQQVWGQAPTPNYQRYSARFVATSMESASILTIPAQLMALLPVLSLLEGNQWIGAYRQNTFSGEVDIHDIGAIGLELNFDNNPNGIGTRIDTKAESFRPEHLHRLVSTAFRPGLLISLDVSECGPDTWYNDVFAAAAEHNPKANEAIIEAANCLTNGAFGRYYQGGFVANDDVNRIHLGHYADRNGMRRDIRDIDYLAVLNLIGEKDIEQVQKWSDSFLATSKPLPIRLADRKRIISGLCSDVQYTGFARRVTFAPAFIEALAKACQEAGLVMRPTNAYADLAGYERAVGGVSGMGLNLGAGGNLFAQSYGQQARQYGQPASMFGHRNW